MVRSLELAKQGKWARHIEGSVEEELNLGTVGGAKAVGMADQIGRLKVGYKADVVVFDGSSPAMLAAARQDPVAAVVLHSSIRDVDMVMVDGLVRKEGGEMLDVQVAGAPQGLSKETVPIGKTLFWKNVVTETLKSKDGLVPKMDGIDFKPGEEAIISMWHLDRKAMV